MRARRLALLLLAITLLPAQSPITYQYIYDDLNRLARVIDSTGAMLQYVYDPVGNNTQIVRSTITPGALSIFNVTPVSALPGGTITIQGQGFSTTASLDIVKLNGVSLTVVSATATSLVVQIPAGATSGTITVTVGGVTVNAPSNETIVPAPVILSLAPKAVLSGSPFTLTVTGTNLTGTTFAFSPALPAVLETASAASATLTVSPPASAMGYYTLIATTGSGSSSATPKVGFLPTVTQFNTISIPGNNPNADPDEDGLTNAQELTRGTDPLNADSDGDTYVDGLEVLYGSDPLNPLSIPTLPPSAPYITGKAFSILNSISDEIFSKQTYYVSGLNFSILDSESAATASPQTYFVSGLDFSILNSESAAASSPQTYYVSGLNFSILNSQSAATASKQTYHVNGLSFSILNGPASSARPAPSAPSLGFRVPIDPRFIAEALARGAARVNGKPVCQDSDGDGLCDEDELIIGTNPFLADTDHDGYPDGLELALGSDPLDPNSIPDIRPPGYYVTPPVSVRNLSIAALTRRRQGELNAKNIR